jgi:hypothetical protein
MENVNAGERPLVAYAQPLSRLQVSWGSVLAGAITTLAMSLILWLLAVAIIITAMRPTAHAFAMAGIAAWICAMVATLAGALLGGMVAGYLPGNPRRTVTVAHGFLSWCFAFVASLAMQLAIFGWAARMTTETVVGTATAAVQGAGAAVGGATAGPLPLAQKAEGLLTSLGYPPAQAREMVKSAQTELQRMLHTQGAQPAAAAAEQARGAVDTMLMAAAVYTWLWWGTWVAAGVLSAFGASIMLNRVRKVPELERASAPEIGLPMRPAPTTP